MLLRMRKHRMAVEQFGYFWPRAITKFVHGLNQNETLEVAQFVRVWFSLCGTVGVRYRCHSDGSGGFE